MKVSGFTLVRNGTKFDYPYLESLRSLLPLVDELVINVGKGDDDTLDQIQKFAVQEGQGKVVFFESHWPLDDPEKKKGGLILSEQTNLALDRCTGDWCIYLQADEVFHEADHEKIRFALKQADPRFEVEGLLLDYVHFYGSFDVIQTSRNAYRREVRVIRKNAGALSVGDAQSFRKQDGSKLNVIRSGLEFFIMVGFVLLKRCAKKHFLWINSTMVRLKKKMLKKVCLIPERIIVISGSGDFGHLEPLILQ